MYAGQIWVVQRTASAALAQLPPAQTPLAFYLFACAAAVLGFSVVLQQRATWLFGRFRYQVLAFAVLVFLPTLVEAQGNLANLHEMLAISALVALVLPAPRTRIGQVAEVSYIAVVCLTGFVGLLLSPVALWGAWKQWGSRYVLVRSAVALLAAAVNVTFLLIGGRAPAADIGIRLSTFPGAVVRRVGDGMALGEHILAVFWPRGFIGWLAIPGLLIVVLLAYLLWQDRRGPSWVWLFSGLVWLALGLTTPAASFDPRWAAISGPGYRYSVVAVAAGFLVLVRALGTGQRSSVRVPAALGLGLCCVGLLGDAYLQPRTPAPTPDQLRAWQDCIESNSLLPCDLPQAPEGWTTTVYTWSLYR